MKYSYILALCFLTLAGCSSLSKFLSDNRQHLAHLEAGMSKGEVHAIMGQESARNYNNPYRTAMYPREDGKRVDVFYYWTDGSVSQGISDNELTPVVFVDGKVVGWGREFWSEFVTKYEVRIKTQ
jgi:hypothetical protein